MRTLLFVAAGVIAGATACQVRTTSDHDAGKDGASADDASAAQDGSVPDGLAPLDGTSGADGGEANDAGAPDASACSGRAPDASAPHGSIGGVPGGPQGVVPLMGDAGVFDLATAADGLAAPVQGLPIGPATGITITDYSGACGYREDDDEKAGGREFFFDVPGTTLAPGFYAQSDLIIGSGLSCISAHSGKGPPLGWAAAGVTITAADATHVQGSFLICEGQACWQPAPTTGAYQCSNPTGVPDATYCTYPQGCCFIPGQTTTCGDSSQCVDPTIWQATFDVPVCPTPSTPTPVCCLP